MSAAIVAAMVAGPLIQAYQSEQARKADKAERKKLEQLIAKVQNPNFDTSDLTPEEFKVIGNYAPEAAAYVSEERPELIKASAAGQKGQAAQLAALQDMRNIASQDRDPAMMAQLDLNAQRSQAEAQSRQRSALDDAARRGQGGSAQTLLAQIAGGEQAMNRNAEMGRQAAIDAYKNRLAAIQNSAQLGGQIRGQDFNEQRSNADIINDYNRRGAAGQNDYLRYRSGLSNDAQLRNMQAQQDVSNQNVNARNQAARSNRDMQNKYSQVGFENDMSRVGLQTGAYQRSDAARTRDTQDRNNMIQGGTNAFTTWQTGEDAKDQRDLDREEREKDRRAYGYSG